MDIEGQIVLVAILEYGELPELLRTANAIRDGMDCKVVFFFIKPSYRRLLEDTQVVLEQGHRWMDAVGVVHDTRADPSAPGAKVTRVTESVQDGRRSTAPTALKALAIDVINLVRDFRQFRARKWALGRILSRFKPALVVVGQDGAGSELSFLVTVAAQQKIAILLAPFAMFNVQELAEYALVRPSHSADAGFLNQLVALFFPHWALGFRGRRILRLPGSRALGLEFSGLAPAKPWVSCGSAVSSIACDSEMTRRSMIAMDVDPRKTSVVGAAVHDRLSLFKSQSRASLAERFNFRPDRPLIVCGWPANIFPWLGKRTIQYADYPSVSRAWATALSQARDKFQCEVLVSVHPKTLDDELTEPHARGLKTVRGDTDEFIAHCDLFTTLNGSSVTAWAIACAKPVLLFDCFETGYPEFEAAPGCLMVQTGVQFLEKLMELAGDAEARRRLAEKQAGVAADWGVLDGCARSRLQNLVRKLVTSEQSSQRDSKKAERLAGIAG